MIKETKTTVLEGLLEKDPYGTWDDVDKGFFVDRDSVTSPLWDLRGKKIRITIQEISD